MVSVIKGLKEQLQEVNEPYILVDIGDHIDRAHFITEGSDGKANVEMMNQVGYDYATIGNNEGITFSKDQLDVLYKDASFKILLNNLFEKDGTRPSWLQPYTIHTLGDLKVGLIGSTIDFTPFYNILGWEMVDAFSAITENVQFLRDKVEFLVVLSHLGLPKDEKLAETVEGIDLILGAHTHHVLHKGLRIDQTWINQAGKFGQFVGHVTVEWDKSHKTKVSSRCVSVQDEIVDASSKQILTYWERKAEKNLAEQVTIIDEEMPATWFEESILGNLLAEGLNSWCKGSIAMVNSGVILDRLPQGKITKRDIHRICPHPINPCVIKINGNEIWSLLQRSMEEEIQKKEIKGFGFRGKMVGMLSLDGMEVYFKTNANNKKVIEDILINDDPIQRDKFYNLATIDMFTFQRLFTELYQPKQVQFFLPELIRDILEFRLEQGDLDRAKAKRWKQKEGLT